MSAQGTKDLLFKFFKDDPEFVIGWNTALEYSAKWIEEAGDDKHISVAEFAELNATSLRAAKREVKQQDFYDALEKDPEMYTRLQKDNDLLRFDLGTVEEEAAELAEDLRRCQSELEISENFLNELQADYEKFFDILRAIIIKSQRASEGIMDSDATGTFLQIMALAQSAIQSEN